MSFLKQTDSFSFMYSLTLNLNLATFKWLRYMSVVNQSHMWKQMTKIPSSPLCNTAIWESGWCGLWSVTQQCAIPYSHTHIHTHTHTHTHRLKTLSDPDCNWPWDLQASAAKPLLIWPALIKLHTVVLSVRVFSLKIAFEMKFYWIACWVSLNALSSECKHPLIAVISLCRRSCVWLRLCVDTVKDREGH